MGLVLADAELDQEINFEANTMLSSETDQWSTEDTVAQARRLAMPCWFIHGSRDPRPWTTVADLANTIRHAELHIIDGAGHKPWSERPNDLRILLNRLVASTVE